MIREREDGRERDGGCANGGLRSLSLCVYFMVTRLQLVPIGVLAPCMRMLDGSVRPPINMSGNLQCTCLQSHLQTSPPIPLLEPYDSFSKYPPFPTKNCTVSCNFFNNVADHSVFFKILYVAGYALLQKFLIIKIVVADG